MSTFSLLYVCTGNICRSPMAERITRQRISQRLGEQSSTTVPDFVVGSAGTWGHVGSPMTSFAARALHEHGIDPDGFSARELTADQVTAADLVLTMTVEHRGHVVGLVPAAVRRTFTLVEFARLVRQVDPRGREQPDIAERARALVAEALAHRGLGPRGAPGADDIDDPYGAPLQVYRERLRDIAEAVDQVVAALVLS